MGYASLSEAELKAVLRLAGLPDSGSKGDLVSRLEAAIKAGPDEVAALRNRIRDIGSRVASLEEGAVPLAKEAPAAEPAAAPAAAAVVDGPTAADVKTYMGFTLPKSAGKPTDEQKATMAKITAQKKAFLAALSKRLGGTWSVKVCTKALDKMAKTAAAPEAAVEKPAEVRDTPGHTA